MKRLLIFLLLNAVWLPIWSQTVLSSCNTIDSIAKKYRNDADELAVRRTYAKNTIYKDSASIDNILSDQYLNALLAVYNATSLAARDTVVRMLDIRVIHHWDLNHLAIAADSNLIWMKQIRNNVIPTGSYSIDYFLNKYQLNLKNYSNIFGHLYYHTASFETDVNCNIHGLSQLIDTISGVAFAQMNQGVLDGPDIYDSINPNFIMFNYRYGWLDCWNGCTLSRVWKFKVYNNCSVEYVGVSGTALPQEAFVGLTENEKNRLSVKCFPNPTTGKIRLTFNKDGTTFSKYSLSNNLGEVLFYKDNLREEDELDLSNYPNGMYYITFNSDKGSKTIKLVKE